MRILIASGNEHKLREVASILTPRGFSVVGAQEVGGIPDVEEDGETFEYNARKKALACAEALDMPALADDSGLVVPALDGKPGVRSARYAGENATDEDNLKKLLSALEGISERHAYFVCIIACALPHQLLGTASGSVHGRIIEAPRGTNGFGYDPVFVPDGRQQTLAELTAEQKNSLSHRSEALRTAVREGLFDHI